MFTHFVVFIMYLPASWQIHDFENNFLLKVINEFHMENPRILHVDHSTVFCLMKRLFQLRQSSSLTPNFDFNINRTIDIKDDTIVAVENVDELKKNFDKILSSVKCLVLIVKEDDFESLLENLEVPIDKEVYLIKESTQEVYETYTINNYQIKNKLKTFNKSTQTFMGEVDVEHDFIKRRSNFHGLNLKAMTEATGNDMKLDSIYSKEAKFFPSNETYLVTGFTDGIYHEILMALQNELNFTAQLYKRKKVAWGFVYPQPDGSYKGTGMVGDLFNGRVDMVVASMAMLHQRALYIDYLVPLTQYTVGLFISTTSTSGDIHYGIYFTQFR